MTVEMLLNRSIGQAIVTNRSPRRRLCTPHNRKPTLCLKLLQSIPNESVACQLRLRFRADAYAVARSVRTGRPPSAAEARIASHNRAMRRPISGGHGFAISPARTLRNCCH